MSRHILQPDRPPAIVLGRSISSLGVVRSLALQGIRSILVSGSKFDPTQKSRFVLAAHFLESHGDEEIMGVLDQYRGSRHVIIAVSDIFVAFLSRHEKELRRDFDFIVPPKQVVSTVIDKALETEKIETLGFPLPKTVRSLPGDPSAVLTALTVPVIVKPRTDAFRHAIGRKNLLVRTRDELDRFYALYGGELVNFLAQEVIPGGDDKMWVCNCTFDWQHNLLNAFTFNRLGTTPAHYGVTSFAISRKNEEIVEHVRRLGKALGYRGPAMFEFKYDDRDQSHKYIELNPRLGMCNFFDTLCGINNVLATYELSQSRVLACNPILNDFKGRVQRDNIVYIDLFRDAAARLQDHEELRRIMLRYLKFGRHEKARPLWWIRDPAPTAYAALRFGMNEASALFRKFGQRPGKAGACGR